MPVVCVVRKLRPCVSYSGRRDRINSVLLRSLDKHGGGGGRLHLHHHQIIANICLELLDKPCTHFSMSLVIPSPNECMETLPNLGSVNVPTGTSINL